MSQVPYRLRYVARPELQIRGGIMYIDRAPDKRGMEDNSKIILLMSQPKHML